MNWLFQQPPAWLEIVIGVVLLVVGLFAEDWIDQWRGRQRKRWVDRASEALMDRHDG